MTLAVRKELTKLGRQALVATKARKGAPTLCGQGGSPLGRSEESWPVANGEPLFPILTIHTPELPHVPEFLAAAAYWSFFIQRDLVEQSTDKGTFVVRSYADKDGLIPLKPPLSRTAPRARSARVLTRTTKPSRRPEPLGRLDFSFRRVTDYPSSAAIRKIWKVDDDEALDLSKEFPCHSGTKLGGFPHLIQQTAFLMTKTPDFQMQFDITDLYRYADSGIGYVYRGLKSIIWESM